MHIITSALAHFIIFMHKKLGINGILLLVLLIEIPCCLFYYSDNSTYYRIDENLQLMEVETLTPITYEELPENEKQYHSDFNRYYVANVVIGNYYYTEDHIPSLSAEDPDGEIIPLKHIDYYDEYESLVRFPKVEARTMIPAGTSVTVPHLFHLADYELNETEFISMYFYDAKYDIQDIEEQLNKKLRIIVPFTP